MNLINLRAEVAQREEDYRIASKHLEEAAARTWSKTNQRAYERARDWSETCYLKFAEAREKLIRATEGKDFYLHKSYNNVS